MTSHSKRTNVQRAFPLFSLLKLSGGCLAEILTEDLPSLMAGRRDDHLATPHLYLERLQKIGNLRMRGLRIRIPVITRQIWIQDPAFTTVKS